MLGLVLIAAQAFFYNGLSFSFPLVLCNDFGVPAQHTGLYVMVISAANLLGPVLLGHFFDSIGRRKMISAAYGISALVVVVTQIFFLQGVLTANPRHGSGVTFFCASAAASAGYLTVSEVFPLEMSPWRSPSSMRSARPLAACWRDPVWLPDRSRPARPAGERLFARRRGSCWPRRQRNGGSVSTPSENRSRTLPPRLPPSQRSGPETTFSPGTWPVPLLPALLALSVITLQARHTICTESFVCLRTIRETSRRVKETVMNEVVDRERAMRMVRRPKECQVWLPGMVNDGPGICAG